MSAAPPLLSAAVRQLSRSAYGVIVKPARGFQVFRIDGYSCSKRLIALRRRRRNWRIDYYPNGSDSTNKDSISVYLPSDHPFQPKRSERVGVDYKFTLLDHSGNGAYELPAGMGVVKFPAFFVHRYVGYRSDYSEEEVEEDEEEHVDEAHSRVGHAEFIAMEELERRRETLLRGDSLAIRCDVGVAEIAEVNIAPKESQWGEGGGKRRRQMLDDEEYIRRCLAKNRGASKTTTIPAAS
nr:unnamed protein product [Digitaria exilis]